MRVLEVIETLDTGGAERVVTNLAFALQARGCDVHIICLRDKGVMPVAEEEFHRRGIRLSALGKRDGFSAGTARRIAQYAKRHGIQVIHTHNPQVNHYGAIASRLAGIPLVNTVHGTSTLNMRAAARTLFLASCSVTTRVVPVCRSVYDVCKRRFYMGDKKLNVVHNGIELQTFLAIPSRAKHSSFVFGTVGRLSSVKDHDSLLRAFALLRNNLPQCKLRILGIGELKESLTQLTRELGIAEAVEFCGFSREIASFLEELDCFVMSSKSEGLPMALLEAMAGGLPVVSTAVGAIPELVEGCKCGWLCPPGNPAELARAMAHAVEAEDLQERGARARVSVSGSYSVAKMGDEYLSLFRDLVSHA